VTTNVVTIKSTPMKFSNTILLSTGKIKMISNENQVSDLGFLLFLTFVKDPPMTKEIFLSGTSVT
jgi:hypothetical protein